MIKSLIVIAVSLIFSNCGEMTSKNDSIVSNINPKQKVSDIQFICDEDLNGQKRNIEIRANATLKLPTDSLHIFILDNKENPTKKFAPKKDGFLSTKQTFGLDTKIVNYVVYSKGSSEKIIESSNLELDIVCADNYEQIKMLGELSESINSNNKADPQQLEVCRLGPAFSQFCDKKDPYSLD